MALLERVLCPDGSFVEIRGPPYTEEEEDEFYHRHAQGMMSGQATVVHPTKPAASKTDRPDRPAE